ncbi:Cytochrome P450 monooxygenase 1 [Colletotrichum siamense]|uniref:Cytochrome P450 monooxygenase 1 n=1 Tax=Colletotrichum siamense TaxID=690259 RepID=A0A9P5K4Q2_COLSI|nr:Cytochrome P450 monooxygenase 1 [Colletotrichum siamense]KAF4858556.1 Cytochrome P450 monooxygenase 1 [Colletotrichum siamense]
MFLQIDIWTGLLAFFGLIAVYLAFSVFYNLYLHPLRNFPGPVLLRATRLGFGYKLNKGTLPFDILELHKKYGDIVRVAPNELAFNNVSAWKDIMGHRSSGAPEFEKYQMFYRPVTTIPSTIVSSGGKEHALLRRSMSHGFSERSLRDQQPLIMQYVNLFIQRLHENCAKGEPIDLMAWYNFTTFDIIGDLAFGEPFGCLERSDYHPWIRTIFISARLGTVVQTANHYPWMKKLMLNLLATKSARASRGKNLNNAREKVQRRMDLGGKGGRPDLIEGLLKKKDELGLSFDQLAANSNTLVIGGSETTATLLSGVTYYLLTNQHTLEKLVSEVRSTFEKEDDITIISVNKLSYMLACLDEALRIYPPVSMGLPRVTPKEGATVCGRFIPGNMTVAIHQWAIHHNEAYFKDPFSFRPERFLGDPEFASDNRDAFQPFHIGARNCLGRNLAYVEMRLILARLIWSFDLELAEESRDWVGQQKVFILWDKGPLKVHLKPVARA